MFASGLDLPIGITFGLDGNAYVGLGDVGTVMKLDGVTGASSVFATGHTSGTYDVAFGPDPNDPGEFDLYVTGVGSSAATRGVMRFDGATGVYETDIISGGNMDLSSPKSLLVGDNYLYISDGGNHRVLRYEWATKIKDVLVTELEGAVGGLNNPSGLAFDNNGDLLVSSYLSNEVLRFDIDTGTYMNDFVTVIYKPTFSTKPLLLGDANRDGTVDASDAEVLANNWLTSSGATWLQGDFTGDGAVNDMDATIMAANWTIPMSAAVPEPSTLVLLLGMFVLLAMGRIGMKRNA